MTKTFNYKAEFAGITTQAYGTIKADMREVAIGRVSIRKGMWEDNMGNQFKAGKPIRVICWEA
jgi:hypothetical protein